MSALQRVRTLGRDLAVYGAGDVATQVLSLLLLPLYVRYLSPGDYGVLALLITVEMLTRCSRLVWRIEGKREPAGKVPALINPASFPESS